MRTEFGPGSRIGSVTQQTSGHSELAPVVDRRHRVVDRQRGELRWRAGSTRVGFGGIETFGDAAYARGVFGNFQIFKNDLLRQLVASRKIKIAEIGCRSEFGTEP